jgi:uncharacterized protein (TIGR03435 family)
MRVAGRKVTLVFLAEMVGSAPVSGLDRLVFDHSGLTGAYDISIEWTPGLVGPTPPGFTPDDTGPSFAEALRDQLGLKLESEIGPVDVVVIDHVEQPSAN